MSADFKYLLTTIDDVSIQLVSPASGDLDQDVTAGQEGDHQVSIQLVSPASGD